MSDSSESTLDWARIQRVFHEALEREAGERTRYLDAACAGDPGLRLEVDSLLAHASGGLLGEPADAPPEAFREQPFGEYRLLRPLGRGGMGNVYLAERTRAGFSQRVALKLLRPDFFHPLGSVPGLEERFARERQILARLEHPGIARLIDGGYGPGGQPYLAMEYVEGESLTDFVVRHGLSVEARLELFIGICEALHYAHQRLVVHRDLKPSNIVIPASGEPRLLDFGIATLVEPEEDPDITLDPAVTRTGHWFTPSYASPEQVRRERVTTLSDIYTLGVLLYELLTGQLPYQIEELTPAAMELVVCGRIPERPSTRVTDPRVARRLRGDLDTIVLKALAKEPDRRYRSAQDLAGDLRRHLNHEPVTARPDSLGYRLRTFARRHRAGVVSAALVLIALVAGLITTTWQARVAASARERAEAALARSEQVTDFLVDLFHQSNPLVAPVDAAFAAGVLSRGMTRVGELEDHPEVQARLLDALGQLTLSLGHVEEADTMMNRALALRRRLHGEQHPDVAVGLQHLGRVRRVQGRYPEAEQLYLQALDIFRRTTGAEHQAYTEALSDLGFLYPYLSRWATAESTYREVLAIRRRTLPPDDPAVADAVMRVATTLRAEGLHQAAESAAREGLALRRQALGPLHPDVGTTLYHLADILFRDSTRWAEAESLYQAGMAVQRQALGERYHGLSHGMGNLAGLFRRQRRYAEAESLLQAVLALREAALGSAHPAVAYDRAALADVWADQGRLDEAIAVRREVAQAIERHYGPEHSDVAGALDGLSQLYRRRGNLAGAESLLVRTVAIRQRAHGPRNLLVGRGLATLGAISIERRQYDLARGRLLEALQELESSGVAFPEEIVAVRANLARAYRALGRPEDAARYEASGG